MTVPSQPRKLIEVALPLDAINVASQAETSNPFIKGHPKSLKWWTRKPLGACRAVLFAQLVDDPSAHPEEFRTEQAQAVERERLFAILADLVRWDNTNNEEILEVARAEIRRSCGDFVPPILDPFAGGGSIPLEAQRLGLEALAGDLNPVAVLINKALVEIPPRWQNRPPIHPEADNRMSWPGVDGLAEDIRRYGSWVTNEAKDRTSHLYEDVIGPDGQGVETVAWIWARCVTCPNPACGAVTPLASSFWLTRKKGREAWIRPQIEGRTIAYKVENGSGQAPDAPKNGRGANFRCLVCDQPFAGADVAAAYAHRPRDPELMAIVAAGKGRKLYLSPPPEPVSQSAVPPRQPQRDLPNLELPDDPRVYWFKSYGVEKYSDLFTERQAETASTIVDLLAEVRVQIEQHFAERQAGDARRAREYSRDVVSLLTLALNRHLMFNNSICSWNRQNENITNPFAMTAPVFAWEFAESNPFGAGVGFGSHCLKVAELVENACRTSSGAPGTAYLAHAGRYSPDDSKAVICTDPPYYSNAVYSDLANFFQIWQRQALAGVWPELADLLASPTDDELVSAAYRSVDEHDSEDSFEQKFGEIVRSLGQRHIDTFPMVIFYAFKQSERVDAEGGLTSTGWSAILEAIVSEGWQITATWPLRTEREARARNQASNALAATIALACRPRPASAAVTDRQGLLRALHEELPGPVRDMQMAHVTPVDLRQAAIGPGMAVFSRYAKVIEPDGTTMRVRTGLGLINQVLGKVLDEQDEEFDSETRWAIQWFSKYYGDEGPYGIAEQLAVSMNVAVDRMDAAGIVDATGGKVRLLGRDELPDNWDPLRDFHTPVWEATQHLVKRLESDGEAAAGQLLRKLGGLGEPAQLLAYRLYTICEKARPALAGPYNALVASWPEIQRHARESVAPSTVNEQQSFDA